MAIVVACRCGQAFEADLYLAGKVVQCPSCRSPIAVPTPAAEEAPAYIPRQRSTVSRESKEATQSIVNLLVAGAVLIVVVLGLSLTVIGYLKGKNPASWIEKVAEQEKKIFETPVQQDPDPPVAPGLVPVGPNLAVNPAAPGGLPAGWNFYDHATGRFSAMFPDAPSTLERMVETTGGNSTLYILSVSQGTHVYEASREYRSYVIPAGGEAAAYETLLSRWTRELEAGTLEASKNSTLDGRLVCDAILRGSEDGKEVRKYLRINVKGNEIFSLSCSVPPGQERAADIQTFLGNFRLP